MLLAWEVGATYSSSFWVKLAAKLEACSHARVRNTYGWHLWVYDLWGRGILWQISEVDTRRPVPRLDCFDVLGQAWVRRDRQGSVD